MKSTLTRRLVRLEKARMGVKSLSDEDLERGIDLSLASLGGQSLTPSEKAELARIQSSHDAPRSPLSDAELVANIDRKLKALGRPGLAALSKFGLTSR